MIAGLPDRMRLEGYAFVANAPKPTTEPEPMAAPFKSEDPCESQTWSPIKTSCGS